MNILKKWWFWLIVLILIALTIGVFTADLPQSAVQGASTSFSGGGGLT